MGKNHEGNVGEIKKNFVIELIKFPPFYYSSNDDVDATRQE